MVSDVTLEPKYAQGDGEEIQYECYFFLPNHVRSITMANNRNRDIIMVVLLSEICAITVEFSRKQV